MLVKIHRPVVFIQNRQCSDTNSEVECKEKTSTRLFEPVLHILVTNMEVYMISLVFLFLNPVLSLRTCKHIFTHLFVQGTILKVEIR